MSIQRLQSNWRFTRMPFGRDLAPSMLHRPSGYGEAAQQQFALRTIRSLLEDGLMQIGDLPYPGEKFAGWDVSIDAAMQRVHDLFVRRYDDRASWDLTIWLGLTPAGERQAHKLKGDATD